MPPRNPSKRAKPAAKKGAPRKAPASPAAARKGAPRKTPVQKTTAARTARHEAAAPAPRPPRAADSLALLRRLCEAPGVSGEESAVRKVVLEAIAGHVDETRTDTLGNVLAVKKCGQDRAPRVMVTAHMDEVGLMVVAADSDGHLRFDTVGGLDERVLLGKPVLVGAERVPGVIGAKPLHLLKSSEASQVVKLDALRIDVGAANKEAALRKARPGDRATFAAHFTHAGDTVRARALDNRVGCAALIELLRGLAASRLPFDLWAAFTVQEEIGLRGARVAAYAANPDLAFILECTAADDLPPPDEDAPEGFPRLGDGPAITVMDRSFIADRRLVDLLIAAAEAEGIPYQFKRPGVGGTDAGAVHLARAGVPSVAVSVPARYIHSPAAVLDLADFWNTVKLMQAALKRLLEQEW